MSNLRNLRLSRDQYNRLTKRIGGDILVLQFYYPQYIQDNSPTLRAYAMKRGHKKVRKNAFEDLSYDPGFAIPAVPEIRIQGDLQIIIDEMEELKEDSNPQPEIYSHFLFQPKFLSTSNH